MKNVVLLIFIFQISTINHPLQSQEISDEFSVLFNDLFQEDEPGGSILVMKGDEIKFLGKYGLADLRTKEKITENTVFNTGSISKTFVANGILILAEKGTISIKDPISKYFDDFDHTEIANQITIEHLLSHTSGLPDIRNVRNNQEFFLTAKDKENWEPIKRTEAINFAPGSKFEYSNPAFNGLALIIEEVSGQKWQSFIKDEIFKPSDMENSKITDGPHPNTGVAHAYDATNDKFVENDYGEFPTFAAAGNGGIWSTVIELAKYEKALRSEIFLSKEMIDQSRKPFKDSTWDSDHDPHIGYSWFLGEQSLLSTNELGVDIVYHTGSQGGFRAFFISVPQKDLLYVALFNRPFPEYRKVMKEGLQILKSANWLEDQ